ncbi:hypothetical protein LSH36_67g06031 [Paralvinella palmiformis]|uniref:Complex 1 LYR protein domain-containing protein n=1 Tax=Paralvinella palmiformis TaxID=53620 RepID=A0AAD9NBU1_9ANNE|nr:hypothetical protein LSH36_67g06031 [Paralvinella palmiformis]
MKMSQTRVKVLSLYRRILRLSYTWKATNCEDTQKERTYIRQEARRLFKNNKHITDRQTIIEHLQEGEARVDLAVHYNIPYPRPMNYPQTVLPPATLKRSMKKQEEILKASKSIYLKSLYEKPR